jgi:aminobenzoyl-glutamate utilization protein B
MRFTSWGVLKISFLGWRAPPLAALLLASAAAAPAGASVSDNTRIAVLQAIDAAQPGIEEDADAIWNFAELGFQEVRSSGQLQSRLKNAGFDIDAGVAGMPTAFIARYRTGPGPVIAILAEFDSLPGLSQEAVPIKQAAPHRHNGHGCGHNLFGAASTGAAIALAEWMKAAGVQGEIRVYGSPAEEGGSGKVYLVRENLFSDVAMALHWHPGNTNDASQTRWLANISGKFRFHGTSSHSAAAPDRGRSALDGVQVMNTATEFLREHVPDGTRIHYVITNGGEAPNVVPDFAETYYYVRSVDPDVARSVWERVKKAAEGAAIATETTHTMEVISGTYSMLPNETLGRVVDAHLRSIGGVALSPGETEFAHQMRSSFPQEGLAPLEEYSKIRPYSVGAITYASSDVSDVSWVTPTVGLFTATFVPGSPGHSWQTSAAAGTSIGHKGAILAAKVMALTAAEALTSPELLQAAKAEFEAARGPNFEYSAMLGDRPPALNFRERSGGE